MPSTISGSQSGTVGLINALTRQLTTSGTSIDFTGIPSGVQRIQIGFSGVSTSGTSAVIVQLGSGSFTTTGYTSSGNNAASGAGWTIANFTNGLTTSFDSDAARTRYGIVDIITIGSNIWVAKSVFGNSASTSMSVGAGGVTLAGTLDRVRITTSGGTDTFDAGSINVLYQ